MNGVAEEMNILSLCSPTWQVQDKAMAVNVAYTAGDLSLHTDYPALHHPPGVSLSFHRSFEGSFYLRCNNGGQVWDTLPQRHLMGECLRF